MKKNHVKLLLGAFLVAVGIVYLIFASLQGATVYYVTVEEFLERQDSFTDEGIRIAGIVADGSITRNRDVREVSFAIQGTSKDTIMPVFYKGIVPDIFRDGASVVLEGKYNRGKNMFYAATLMTSCPSKYESELRESSK